MQTVVSLFQIITALGLLNVWLIRANARTDYRGKNAKNIQEEFAVYGLPRWTCFLVGALKVAAAICLIAGFWFPQLVVPASTLVALLMLGAVVMHMKVKDPLKKSIPALSVLAMCLTISLWR